MEIPLRLGGMTVSEDRAFSCSATQYSMRMAASGRFTICLLLMLHSTRAQNPSEDSSASADFLLSPQSLVSLLLLALTVTLSGAVYLWILRYVCIGCCQPVTVGPESEALAVMV